MKEEQYPKNFIEFLDQFKDEDSCRNYLFELKWSEGFHCPKCNNDTYWLTAQNLIHCRLCGHQTSLTAGTIFHGTRKPLILWFHVIWWVVAQKTGVSASNMTNFMGFGTYRTAWTWLQKLRRAMVRPGRDRLSGLVEVDETFIGGVEAGSGNTGRGSTVIIDGWPGYKPLQDNTGYKHEVKVVFGSGKEAHELLPHVHMVDSLLKRWLNGTHQGKVSPKYSKYLPYYLDEFAFRFNRKMSTFRGKLFYRLMQQAVDVEPVGLNYIIENHT